MLGWNPRELTDDLIVDEIVGNDPEILFFPQRHKALDGLLDHRIFSIQGEHLLGQTAAAARPEPCATPACQYHWIEMGHRKQIQQFKPSLIAKGSS
jgi:hypothetical protein